MNPVELRELMKDADERGKYLAAICHRGKDVLLGDIEKLIEIMIDEAVEIEERKTENAILNQKLSAYRLSQQNIINAFGIAGEGEHSKLVIEYVMGLAAENSALKAENCIQDFIISAVKDLVRESDGVTGWHRNGDIASWDEVLPELSHSETPITDADIAEIESVGAEKMFNLVEPAVRNFCNSQVARLVLEELAILATDLRAGRKG
ncbi:hypothetical protein ACMV8I_18855 [Ewingella sp. S1.OA.A_B6]